MRIELNPNAAHILKIATGRQGSVRIKLSSTLPIVAFLTSDENARYLEANNEINPSYSVQTIAVDEKVKETNVIVNDRYNNLVLVNKSNLPTSVSIDLEEPRSQFPGTATSGTTGMGF